MPNFSLSLKLYHDMPRFIPPNAIKNSHPERAYTRSGWEVTISILKSYAYRIIFLPLAMQIPLWLERTGRPLRS